MSSFAALKKASALDTLVKKLEQSQNSYGTKDERFWEPTQDKNTGLGSAIIRFLPTAPADDAPWAKVHSHGFKNEDTGKWFIMECPTTIGGECYCCNQNQPLWKGSEADKKVAASRKRKTHFISNILVIKDPANPENNGKQFLFRYGKQIFDKIIQKIKPEFEDDSPVNVFDFWAGCELKLRINRNEGGFKTFEKSTFDEPTALFGGDDTQLEAIWNKQYSLKEFMDPSKFPTEQAMKEKFDQVVNGTAPVASSAANRVLEQMGGAASKPSFAKKDESEDDVPATTSTKASVPDGSDDAWDALLADL